MFNKNAALLFAFVALAILCAPEAFAGPGDIIIEKVNQILNDGILKFFKDMLCEIAAFFPSSWGLRCNG